MARVETTFRMQARRPGKHQPVLRGVDASGRLSGMLFELTLRQTYHNPGAQTLEVIYNFPLPCEARLMGFATELNGKRMAGQLIERRAASAQYEAAMESGDAPILLERSSAGLHTVNIGNLQPGDDIVVEITYAQVLRFDQGRVRLAVPCTIAPRYGQPAQAGLQPQQAPEPSALVAYPLSLSITLDAALARGHIELPTHAFSVQMLAEGARLTLAPGASMDRDIVLAITPEQARASLAVGDADPWNPEAPQVVLAAFQPPAPTGDAPCFVKLLVDCSGSMNGDSIASARRAVEGVIAGLDDNDFLSVSRFGNTCVTMLAPTACSPRTLRHFLPTLQGLQADLGGTEMTAALQAVFDLDGPRGANHGDVLLITDGEIWQADALIASARRSGQRVFIIGVGSSPAEHVLRGLADATGGACEFATPGEALEAAALRMLRRMRQGTWNEVHVDWGVEPAWQSPAPTRTYGGDTYLVCAGFRPGQAPRQARLLTRTAVGEVQELAQATVTFVPGSTEAAAATPTAFSHLARVAADMRMGTLEMPPVPTTSERQQRIDHALRYQLLTDETHYLLVHVRAAGEKSGDESQLHVVTPMMAAGHAGFGGMAASLGRMGNADAMEPFANMGCAWPIGPVARAAATPAAEIPAFLRKASDATVAPPADPQTDRTHKVLQQALNRRPHRVDWILLLLEILARLGRREEFARWAQRLLERVGSEAPAWQRACALGRALDPHNALYQPAMAEAATTGAPGA